MRNKTGKFFSGKLILLLGVVAAACYLLYKYPDYSILGAGIIAIIIIGTWLQQAYGKE